MMNCRLYLFIQKNVRLLVAGILLISLLASTAGAESYVAYPVLPTGYSSIRVFDSQNRFVGRILPEKRYWVPIERIPVFMQRALVAVEDSRFYEHGGIDMRGIARALVKDVVKGRMAEGGSTITQQLIKNKYLSGEKSIDRKIKEAKMAMEFEEKYSKKQILEMYFNEIYYGHGAWGIAQAARIYFDKNPEELTDGECSMLAGIPKNPGRYNPLGKPALVAGRKGVVLKRMLDTGMISAKQYKNLLGRAVKVVPPNQAPYYLAHIRNKLIERYGAGIVEQGGVEVFAAMDLKLQKLAEQAVTQGVRKVSPELQGALIAMNPVTGDILAAVGGVDYARSPYNRAFSAKRQPGSTIKPLIYAAALENGYTASSIINDTPVAYNRGNGGVWKPLNYGNERKGNLSLRQALAYSNNVITVKLLEAVGVENFVDFAAKTGLALRKPNDLSLALGSEEVTLNELVAAYAPLANGGSKVEPRTIVRIYENSRRSWHEVPAAVTPAIAPATVFVTTNMLRDVMTYGTAKSLKKFSQGRPAAGKTGTTNDYRDAWFVGYTPQIVTGVWVGYDKPRPGGKSFTGGAIAVPIWERFMRPALAGKPVMNFPQPETVVSVSIDPKTGYLATPDCPQKRNEFYAIGAEPTGYCPKHGAAPVEPSPPASQQPNVPGQQPENNVESIQNGGDQR